MGTFYIAGVSGPASFAELLIGFVRRFGSQSALGKAIEISPSRLSRVIQGQHSLEVVNCLRLADVTGESPSVILRAAGKADVAELIERMYGESRPRVAPALTPDERELIEVWDAIPDEQRAAFGVMLRYTRDVAAAGAPSRTAPPPTPRARRRSARPRARTPRQT